MRNDTIRYYPTTLEAVYLLVLYLFLQSLVDFPLALYDYNHDTHWLNNQLIGSLSSIIITSFIFILGYKRSRQSFSEVFKLRMFNVLLIVPVVALLIGLQYLVGFLNLWIEKVLPAPSWFWELFERMFNNRFGFWGSLVKVAVLAPIVEETLFRGILMNGFMRNYKPWYAVFLSGLLFSLYHMNPWQMSYTFFLGLFLGWLMISFKSLPLCIVVHSLNNLIVMANLTWEKEISESPVFSMSTNVNVAICSALVVVGVLLVAVIKKITLNKRRRL